ncbi:MAG: hypothetical protein GF344_15330 [Chitinivibrionales bacterium]|nr:hypothetical protein [Chitinivibrionales bacterium]MBD3358078.1 hypothetical protein [Chitinivibrionales bacterium]
MEYRSCIAVPLSRRTSFATAARDIEIYYVCADNDIAYNWLGGYLADYHNISRSALHKVVSNYRCTAAVRHLFQVAAGTESMFFREHEILGQIREAYYHCFSCDVTHSHLNRLFQQALATGKQVKTLTNIGGGRASIASIALARINQSAGELSGKRILVIGAGPGEPGLFTALGQATLKRCDVVVFDALVNMALIGRLSDRVRRIYVGKRPGQPSTRQEDINHLLEQEAKKGYTVARLKGGDPFVLGRGSEEIEYLGRCGIRYEIIPGVTSALTAPAWAEYP